VKRESATGRDSSPAESKCEKSEKSEPDFRSSGRDYSVEMSGQAVIARGTDNSRGTGCSPPA